MPPFLPNYKKASGTLPKLIFICIADERKIDIVDCVTPQINSKLF